jgi:hypothetical protein
MCSLRLGRASMAAVVVGLRVRLSTAGAARVSAATCQNLRVQWRTVGLAK